MFSPCVFVCVCLCLSRCLSGRFNYEGLVPHKKYFAGILFGMPSCARYFHVIMTSLMTSPGHKISQILKKSWSRAQNGAHFKNSEILNTTSIWPQIWKNIPNYAKKYFPWWWHHRWRHRVASKFPSIFMFRRGWLWQQVARAMSRQ